MRHCLAAGIASVLIIAANAPAQDSKNQGPVKASIPSGPIFRGGFGRPIFQNGFAHITPPAVPAAQPAGSPPQSNLPGSIPEPQKASTPDPRATSAAATHSAHSQDGEHSGCTGPCANDHDATQGDQAAAQPAKSAENAQRDELIAKLKGAEAARRSAANDDAGKPAQDCNYCHTKGQPPSEKTVFNHHAKAPPDNPVGPDFRLVRQQDTRMRPDPRMSTRAIGEVPNAQPAPTPDVPAATKEAIDRPELIGRDPAAAADGLRDYIAAHTDDFHAARMLAVALLATKHPKEAAAAIAKAYESDPLLSNEPLDFKQLGLNSTQIINLVSAAGVAAKQANTSQSWLLSAAMYQAQGSRSQALAALDKARGAGLNADVGDWLAAQLKKKPEQVAQAAK